MSLSRILTRNNVYTKHRGGNMKINNSIIIVQALINIFGVFAFFIGYFSAVNWLLIAGGIILVADDTLNIFSGSLKPIVPLVFALALSLIMHPWYIGFFCGFAVFAILDIPTSFRNLLNLKNLLSKQA